MTFPGLEKKMEFHDFSRFSMTGYTLILNNYDILIIIQSLTKATWVYLYSFTTTQVHTHWQR